MRAAAALVALSLCSCRGPYHRPDSVRISLVDATIAPSNSVGDAWDGVGKVPPEVIRGLAGAVNGKAGNTARAAAAVAYLAIAASGAAGPPDPRGFVELYDGHEPRRISLPEQHDTFHPVFPQATFDHVPFHENVRVRLTLRDADTLGADDPIGTIELGFDQLFQALDEQKVVQLSVADQSQGQILYVGLSVTAEGT